LLISQAAKGEAKVLEAEQLKAQSGSHTGGVAGRQL